MPTRPPAQPRGAARPPAHGATAAGYRWIDKDPIIDYLMARFRESGLSYDSWAYAAGLSPSTVRNWDAGVTRAPQYRSVVRACLALGLEFGLHRRGALAEPDRLPSTAYYEGDIRRWQRRHKDRRPDVAVPPAHAFRPKETVS